MGELKLISTHEPRETVVASLRKLAEEIEKGVHGEVGCVAVAVYGRRLFVYGFGPASDPPALHYLFSVAQSRLVDLIKEDGDECTG